MVSSSLPSELSSSSLENLLRVGFLFLRGTLLWPGLFEGGGGEPFKSLSLSDESEFHDALKYYTFIKNKNIVNNYIIHIPVYYLFFLLFLLWVLPLSLESLSANFSLSGSFLDLADLLIPYMSGLSSHKSDFNLLLRDLDLDGESSSDVFLSVWWSNFDELALLCFGDDFVSSLWWDLSKDFSEPDLSDPEPDELDPLSLFKKGFWVIMQRIQI